MPVVDDEGRCVGIVTEADLVLPDDQGDLHLPHYVNLFGGTVFLEPLGRFEERLRKAFASTAEDMMTRDPDTVAPDTGVREAARLIHESGHNRLPVVEDGRLVGRGHAGGRARRPRGVSPERGARDHRPGRHRAQLRAPAPTPLCAVVKADGYGHGAGGRRGRARRRRQWLAVATADEAAALRAAGSRRRSW